MKLSVQSWTNVKKKRISYELSCELSLHVQIQTQYASNLTLKNLSFAVTLNVSIQMFSVLSLRSVNISLAVRSSRFFHLIYCQTWGNQFFKLLFCLIESLKYLSIMAPSLRWMFLIMQERVACYAHTWHLPAAALHLPLLTAEPSQTLLFPASSSQGKQALQTSWQSPAECALPQGCF